MTPTGTRGQTATRNLTLDPLVDRERTNPWLFWLAHVGMPMIVSVILHVALFVVLGLTTWQVLRPADTSGDYEASLRTTGGDPFATAFQWPGQERLEDFEPPPTPKLESLSDLRELSRLSDLNAEAQKQVGDAGGFGLGERGELALLGTGSGAPETGRGGGSGSGFGERPGLGRAGVWNLDVAANRICYVVDFSGSTIGAIDDLKRELKRSVGNLRPGQSFNVFIFYSKQDKYVTDAYRPKLVPAEQESKRLFFEWIDKQTPDGHTEPLKAIERALKLEPDAIFLFSDGYFDDAKAEEKIETLNRRVHASINCLVFDDILLENISDLPQSTDGARRMKKIADQNAGKLKIVTGKDLTGR